MARTKERDWLFLIHQIPPKPAYLRVKIWRRLQRLGAVALKNSVYVLPSTEQAVEDFQWVLRELRENGADGTLVEGRTMYGVTSKQIEAMFNAARGAEYDAIAREARSALKRRKAKPADRRAQAKRLQAHLAEVEAIDFFAAREGVAARKLVVSVERAGNTPTPPRSRRSPALYKRVWVTRVGVGIDRIASAWLIRRFIDPEGSFKFVPAKGYVPQPDELRFDMFDAEFTHEGDRCTFEVLLQRFVRGDGALERIGEIVHDLDFKDGKFGRDEAAGIGSAVAGLCLTNDEDEARLARGADLFEGLYQSFRRYREK